MHQKQQFDIHQKLPLLCFLSKGKFSQQWQPTIKADWTMLSMILHASDAKQYLRSVLVYAYTGRESLPGYDPIAQRQQAVKGRRSGSGMLTGRLGEVIVRDTECPLYL